MGAAQQLKPLDKQLLEAVRNGDMAAAKAARKKGADINAVNVTGDTPLLVAVNKQRHNIAQWVLNEGGEVHHYNRWGNSPLFDATWKADLPMVELLLKHGANPNWPAGRQEEDSSIRGFLSLHRASVQGELAIAKALIRAGADVNAGMQNGGKPMWYAAANHHEDVCSLLLAHGADPNGTFESYSISNPKKLTSFHSAVHKQTQQKHIPLLRMLLDAGAEVDIADHNGRTLESNLRENPEQNAEVLAVLKQYRSLPPFSPDRVDSLNKHALFAPDAQGYCLLDNPQTWKHFDAIADALEKQGEALTKEDLQATNKDGKTWLERGSECLAGGAAVKRFAKAGGNIAPLLLDEKNQPRPLFKTLCEREQISHIMTRDVWSAVPNGRMALKTLYEALPREYQADIPNKHQLLVQLDQQNSVRKGR